MVETFNFQYQKAYKVSSQWNTAIDEAFSGNEQRRNLWTNPRKKWVLEFSKNKVQTGAILDFFDARKGSYESFNWVWQATHPKTGADMGGDGNTYRVRFQEDSLDFQHLAMGYTNFQISLIEVVS